MPPSNFLIVTMRKYEPIWLRLKQQHKASLAAPIVDHRRIILAVRKEKTNDHAWKLECAENKKKYKLVESVKGKMITFSLTEVEFIPLTQLTTNDL